MKKKFLKAIKAYKNIVNFAPYEEEYKEEDKVAGTNSQTLQNITETFPPTPFLSSYTFKHYKIHILFFLFDGFFRNFWCFP